MMRFSTLAVAVAIAPLAFAQDESIEEVVVTSSLVHSSLTATAFVVSGDSIAESGSQAIGEHLSTLAGVSSDNFSATHPRSCIMRHNYQKSFPTFCCLVVVL